MSSHGRTSAFLRLRVQAGMMPRSRRKMFREQMIRQQKHGIKPVPKHLAKRSK